MSNVSRFMETARSILNERASESDRAKQNELFYRTGWLVLEIDEAADKIKQIASNLKVAAVGMDREATRRLTGDLSTVTAQMLNMCFTLSKEIQKG